MTGKKILIIILLLVSNLYSRAQTSADQKRINLIAKDFNVSEGKAMEIVAALDHNAMTLKEISKDTVMNPLDRQQLIRSLLAGRQAKIQEVLTPAQQTRLKEVLQASRGKADQHRQKVEKKHEEEKGRSVTGGTFINSTEKMNNSQ
jgi:hypothetical protein